MNSCLLCHPEDAALTYGRRVVWEDPYWRLAVIEAGSPIAGFAHLETKRHIPDITHLDAGEAATLGSVLARVTAKLKAVTGSDLVYVYVFGERVPHLHFNLGVVRIPAPTWSSSAFGAPGGSEALEAGRP